MQSPRHSLPSIILVQLLALALAACGGGGSGGDGASTASQGNSSTSSVAASSAASSSSKSGASSSISSSSSTSSASGVAYAVSPQVSTCTAGQVSSADKDAVLARLNEIRSRHGLPAVSYDSSDDAAAAAAALYMVANGSLTHTPSSSGSCYTSEAARLAGTSNLYMAGGSNTRNMASADAVTAYLVDSNVSSLGHRRWVLYPFLKATTFGRVDSDDGKSMASALRTIGGAASSVSMTNDFVAYPYGSYPAKDFSTSWYLSFSAIASKTNAYANGNSQVSFSSAAITVTNASGQSLTVSDRVENYEGYGLANSLQWKVAGLASGGSYTVTITGVSVNGTSRDYSYGFQLQ